MTVVSHVELTIWNTQWVCCDLILRPQYERTVSALWPHIATQYERTVSAQWPHIEHSMSTQWVRSDLTLRPTVWAHSECAVTSHWHSMSTQWVRSDLTLATLWAHSECAVTSHWPQYERTVSALWPHIDHSMSAQWGRSDLPLTTVWAHSDHSMSAQWPQYERTVSVLWPHILTTVWAHCECAVTSCCEHSMSTQWECCVVTLLAHLWHTHCDHTMRICELIVTSLWDQIVDWVYSHNTIIQDSMIGCTCFCFLPGFLLCCHWPLLSTILWTCCHTSTTLKLHDILYWLFQTCWKYQDNCDKDAPIPVWDTGMIPGIRIRVSVSICRTLKSSQRTMW